MKKRVRGGERKLRGERRRRGRRRWQPLGIKNPIARREHAPLLYCRKVYETTLLSSARYFQGVATSRTRARPFRMTMGLATSAMATAVAVLGTSVLIFLAVFATVVYNFIKLWFCEYLWFDKWNTVFNWHKSCWMKFYKSQSTTKIIIRKRLKLLGNEEYMRQ